MEKANSGTSGEAEITEKLNAPSGATGDAAETAGPVPMLTESDPQGADLHRIWFQEECRHTAASDDEGPSAQRIGRATVRCSEI